MSKVKSFHFLLCHHIIYTYPVSLFQKLLIFTDNFKTVYEQSKADITEGSFPTGNLTTAKLPSSEIVRAGEKTLLDKILNYQIFSSASQSEDLSSVLVYQLKYVVLGFLVWFRYSDLQTIDF